MPEKADEVKEQESEVLVSWIPVNPL
jgi:hypothetical protein